MNRPGRTTLIALSMALSSLTPALAGETGAPINSATENSRSPLDETATGGSTSTRQAKSASAEDGATNQNASSTDQSVSGEGDSSGHNAAGSISTATSSMANKTAGTLAPGPLLQRRQEILNFLNKARSAGIGVKPYEAALESIETDVKAGKTEADIKPRVNSLVIALTKQVENLKSLKATAASKAASAQAGGFPLMGTPESNSGFGFENGVFKIKPARALPSSASGLFSGLSPEYQRYAMVTGRAVPEALLERLLFDLTNKHRRENNLKPYSWNSKLAGLAKGHVQDMVANNFFAHVNKRHQGPLDRSMAAGYNVGVKENIGMAGAGRGTPVRMIILVDDSLMKSPGHRAAILDPKGQGAGMGVCYDLKNGGLKVCQVFSPNDF